MKNIFLSLALMFYSIALIAQNKTILVQYKVDMAGAHRTAILFAKKNNAVYTTKDHSKSNQDKKTEGYDQKTNTFQVGISIDNGPTILDYYLQQDSNSIYFTQKEEEKTYLVKDDLPEVKWDINHTQTKKINQFVCKKATTNFRGSKIVAWYAPEIPIPFGPWKFKGLPGLMLEVYSQNDRFIYHWMAEEIVYPYQTAIEFQYPKDIQVIPYQKVIRQRDEKIKNILKMSDSRMPEGVKTISSKTTRVGIEKVFEWENNESTAE